MRTTGAFEILRPFAWLATAAFLVGFVSYLALGPAPQAMAHESSAPAAQVSEDASWPLSDEWNLAKRI
jgi:hypothetical protein